MKLEYLIENTILNELIKTKKIQEGRFILPKQKKNKFKHFTIAKELKIDDNIILTSIPMKLLYKKSIKQILKHRVDYDTFIRQLNAARIINKNSNRIVYKVFTKLMNMLRKWHDKLPLKVQQHL